MRPAVMRGRDASAGFTLTELMVALLITLVVVGSIFGLLAGSFTGYLWERERLEAQQNTRFASDAVARTLRAAGNNPQSIDLGVPFAFERNPLSHADSSDNLRVRSDYNPPDGDVADPLEDIIIHVSGDTLYYRDMAAGGVDEPQFHYIESLSFDLLDGAGAPTAVIDSVRQVRLVITGRSPRPHPKTGQYHRVTYTVTVAPRPLNM